MVRIASQGTSKPWQILGLVLTGVAVGVGVALSPGIGSLSIGTVLVAALIGLWSFHRPHAAVSSVFLVVLVGSTKFRNRDPTAVLRGEVDLQILFELVLYAYLVIIVVGVFLSGASRGFRLRRIEAVILVYVAVAVASSVWSPIPLVSLVRSSQLVILALSIAMAVRVMGPGRSINTLSSSLICYIAISTALGSRFGPIDDLSGFAGRYIWFSMGPGPVALALTTALILLVCEGLYVDGGWRRRRLGLPVWTFVAPLLLLLFLTQTRTLAIGLPVAMTAVLLPRYGRPWLYAAGVATVLLVSLAYSSGAVPVRTLVAIGSESQNPIVAFLFRGQSVEQFVSLTGRMDLWPHVFALVAERPLLGHGYLASRLVLEEVVPWAGYAHNALGQSLLDLGVVGTMLLGVVVVSCFFTGIGGRSRTRGTALFCKAVLVGLITLLAVLGLTGDSFAGPPRYQVMVLLICALVAEDLRGGRIGRDFRARAHPTDERR